MPSSRKAALTQAEPSLDTSRTTPYDLRPGKKGESSAAPVEDALDRLQHKTRGRHNSYSDSTDGDEEVEEAFCSSTLEHSRHSAWERSVYQTPCSNLGPGLYDSGGQLDDTVHSSFYSPNLSLTRADLSKRYWTSSVNGGVVTDVFSCLVCRWWDRCPSSPVNLPTLSSPAAPSPDPLPPPLPLPLNLTASGNGQDMDELVPVRLVGKGRRLLV